MPAPRFGIDFLVTVKAYPAVSTTYGEAVCLAGIRTDVEPHRFVRLYPVDFRRLPFGLQFRKYEFISIDVTDTSSDQRPESLRPIVDSLERRDHLDTRRKWVLRRPYVESLMAESMCEIRRKQELDGTSLGIFRPAEVQDFVYEPAGDWRPEQEAVLDQPTLWNPQTNRLEKIPYRFKYRYLCAAKRCAGHEQTIIDWEIGEAYRRWLPEYGEAETLQRLRLKWLDDMCGPEKDTAFYVGNQHLHPRGFLVLGVWWPPKS